MKDMKRKMDQLQIAMKNHGLNPDFIDLDLDLDEEESFPLKYKFPNMKKYSSTYDPYLHLKQYVTYMKATGLFKAQIVKQFSLSLEGAVIKWYYTLDVHAQQH